LYRHGTEGEREAPVSRADEEEFYEFAAARMERWRRSAYMLCQNWHTADDLVSMTAAKVYRHWRKVRSMANRDAYAQRILTRIWLDERRRPWRREHTTAEMPERAWQPPDRMGQRSDLAAALRALSPNQRAVVMLRFYLDHSIEETAEILGMSVGTVKSHSSRGLDTLRTRITTPIETGGAQQ
jgi:RNA polymerase sigma-70 factor (sigma-E family)